MAGDGKDWQQAATIASANVTVMGAGLRERFEGATNADGASWAALAPSAGRTVLGWIIQNNHANTVLVIGLGAQTADLELEPGATLPVGFAGTVYVRSLTAAAGSYRAVAMEG